MKATQPKPADELRMSGNEFDKIMRQALQVAPQEAPKVKKVSKAKSKTTKKTAKK